MNRLNPVIDEDGLHYRTDDGRVFREDAIREMTALIGGSVRVVLVDYYTGEEFEAGPVLAGAYLKPPICWVRLACAERSAKASA